MELYDNENINNENQEGEKVYPFENTDSKKPLFDWNRYTIDSEELNKTSVQQEIIPEDVKEVENEMEQVTSKNRKVPIKKKIEYTAFFWLAVVIFTLSCGATVLVRFPQLAKLLNLQSVFTSITSSITTSATGSSNGTQEPQVWFDESFGWEQPIPIPPSSSSMSSISSIKIPSISSKSSSKLSVSLPKSSSSISSSIPSQVSSSTSQIPPVEKMLTVVRDKVAYTDTASNILAQVVTAEMGDKFNIEALKAQVVATHTFILYYNELGLAVYVPLTTPTEKVKQAVAQVLDKKMVVGGKTIEVKYCAMSAGKTNSSKDVWGGEKSYLQSVDSPYDNENEKYENGRPIELKKTLTYSKDDIINLLNKYGIDLTNTNINPSDWFKVINLTSGGYNNDMSIGGITSYNSTLLSKTTKITGRMIREEILCVKNVQTNNVEKMLRSAKFDVSYDTGSSVFTFTTYGYGHGAGMSQVGANGYAKNGLGYEGILKHYYTGITIINF